MNAIAHRPLLTAVLATPETGTAGTFIIMDLLAAVGQLWEAIHGEAPQLPRFLPRLLSADGKPYRDVHGVLIEPHGSIADYPTPDIVMIPELVIGHGRRRLHRSPLLQGGSARLMPAGLWWLRSARGRCC